MKTPAPSGTLWLRRGRLREVETSINNASVQNYPGRNAGIGVSVETLRLHYYDAIREMLQGRSFDREQIREVLIK